MRIEVKSENRRVPRREPSIRFALSVGLIFLLGGRLSAQSCAMCYTTAAGGGAGGTIVGGAGIPLYLAGLLLIPDEGSDQSIASSIIESLQNRNR